MAKVERHADPVADRAGADAGGFRLVDWLPQIIIGAVVVIFIALNTRSVKVSYGFGDVEMPLWLALAGVAVLGAAVGWFLGRRRLKRSQAA